MKTKVLALFVLSFTLLLGCAKQTTPPPAEKTTPPANQQSTGTPNKANATPNAVTTASIVDNSAAFQKAISKNGTWIVAITKDLTVDQDLLVEGEYKNGKKDKDGKDLIQRKIALYAQDENRKITARYTLTAPKMTFTSPMGSLQHGTYKGDLYVAVSNFQLIDATVDGNVYFTTDEAKNTFKMDATSKITGKQELKKS